MTSCKRIIHSHGPRGPALGSNHARNQRTLVGVALQLDIPDAFSEGKIRWQLVPPVDWVNVRPPARRQA